MVTFSEIWKQWETGKFIPAPTGDDVIASDDSDGDDDDESD